MLQWKALRLSAPLYALSAEHPKPFTVMLKSLFWHLAPLQLPLYHSQGKPLIFYIVHSHACFFPRLWEELFSITSFVPKWMSISCMWLWFINKRDFKELSKEEWEKSSPLKYCLDAHGRTIKLSYIFCWTQPQGSQSTAGWGQSWTAGTILPKNRPTVS